MGQLGKIKTFSFNNKIYVFGSIFMVLLLFTFHKLHGGYLGIKMSNSISDIKLSNSFPISLDENLQLNNVKMKDKTLIYEYTIKNSLKDNIDLRKITGQNKIASLSEEICNDERKKDILFLDGQYKYIYYDKNNQYITDLLITKKNCLN